MPDNEPVRGPMMIAATKILRPPEARIGKIGNNITLPRTVPLKTAIAGAVGAVIGIPFALFIFSGPVEAVIFGGIFGGFCGVAAVSYSPLKGESLFSWMGLSVLNARRKKVMYDGEEVQLAVGIARISRGPLERVRILGGAVDVNPDQFDERGVLRTERNRNLAPRRPFPGLGGPAAEPLVDPPEEDVAAVSRRGLRRPAGVPSPPPTAAHHDDPPTPARRDEAPTPPTRPAPPVRPSPSTTQRLEPPGRPAPPSSPSPANPPVGAPVLPAAPPGRPGAGRRGASPDPIPGTEQMPPPPSRNVPNVPPARPGSTGGPPGRPRPPARPGA